jgi:aspartyl-tRNA(Asn)/glutamyl-tRNA(Gln) amidotransferase subunit A
MSPGHDATDPLHYLEATQLARLIRERKVSPVEVVQAHLQRIEAVNPKLNAIVTLMADSALAQAHAAERALAEGQELGPLGGVPFTIKDCLDTADTPTQRGSRLFAGRTPRADATGVARLRAAGAIPLAKTNLPEFTLWWETDNALTGRTNNPWDLTRTPGGSSGGESAAISAGLSPLGIGTDVGISVRGPASLTGLVALKPTHGRIPLTGNYPPGPNRLWHVGPMARSVRDVALAYECMKGPDGQDGFAIAAPDAGSGRSWGRGLPVRVGWIADSTTFGPIDPDVVAAVRHAAEWLEGLGCHVRPARLPLLEEVDCTRAAAPFFAETLLFLRPLTAGREGELSSAGQRLLTRAEPSFAAHVEAELLVERLKSAFAAWFQDYDVLLCPVIPFTAPAHGQKRYRVAGQEVETAQMMRATLPFNLTGLPALAVPMAFSLEGLPIGVQLVARWFDEALLLDVGARLEPAHPGRSRRPDL